MQLKVHSHSQIYQEQFTGSGVHQGGNMQEQPNVQGFASEVYGDWKQTSKNNHIGAVGPASGSGNNINLTNKLTRGNNLN